MGKMMTSLAIVAVMLAVMTPLVIAGEGCSAEKASAQGGEAVVAPEATLDSGEVVNSVCPVMGGKVEKDTPYKVEYKGKVIGFCCGECLEKFNADPEKYAQKLEELETNVEE